jgi:hypothetical protein
VAVLGGLLLAAASRASAEEAGRYQFAIDRIENSSPDIYVMDTATGTILRKDGTNWRLVVPALSPSMFANAVAEYERGKKTWKEFEEKYWSDANVVSTSFHGKTLKEQIHAAEAIFVLQCVEKVPVPPRMRPGAPQPVPTHKEKEFKVVEVLKGPNVSKVKKMVLSQSGNDPTWRTLLQPVKYPQAGEKFESPLTIFHVPDAIKQMDANKTLVCFTVCSEQTLSHYPFFFTNEQLELSEDISRWVVPTAREPSELIEDIKAIVAKEGETNEKTD